MSPKEILEFDDLQQYLLLQNGNFLYKVPYRDGWAVLKVYYGSRGFVGRLRKSFSNIIAGQTSYMPQTRRRIEADGVDVDVLISRAEPAEGAKTLLANFARVCRDA